MSTNPPPQISHLIQSIETVHKAVELWFLPGQPEGTDYWKMINVSAAFVSDNPTYRIGSEPLRQSLVTKPSEQADYDTDNYTAERQQFIKPTLNAFDDAIEAVSGVSNLVVDLLGPTWTSELKRLLIVLRSYVEVTAYDILNGHRQLRFLHGMYRLHYAATILETLDYTSAQVIESKPEWSNAMTRKEMQRRLGGITKGAFKQLLDDYGFVEINRQSIRIRLDTMDAATRRNFEAES